MGAEAETLDRATPEAVRRVCRTLRDSGHQAWAVGGAVRDALLGRPAGDWDVATSAHPDQVTGLFPRTIPTGIQHGTVTVLVGRGDAREAIEVTTFRGEGAYSDARRPDSVHFGVGLDEDLARRDLVVNAMAWDPIDRVLHDPFGGLQDLRARRLRAVGDAAERFREDGLRVMRAVRFAAQLEFALDASTEAAIPVALPSLQRVAVERIRDELYKLLEARVPSLGLSLAIRTGIVAAIWDGWPADHQFDLERVDRTTDLLPRLASLLLDLGPDLAEVFMRQLKASNDERDRVVRMVRFGRAGRDAVDAPGLRRLLCAIGRRHAADVLAVWDAQAFPLAGAARKVLDRGDALGAGELAIKGGEVMRVLGIGPGKEVGQLLEQLLDRVLEDPALNTRERLEALVVELRQK